MRKRLKKRAAKIQAEIVALNRMEQSVSDCIIEINNVIISLNNSLIRITNLLHDQHLTLTKFPLTVRDFATDPPIHAGEYIIWFIRMGVPLQSRKYVFNGSKWFDQKGDQMDIRQYKPAMWMLLPTFSEDLLEIYRRRT